MFELHVGVILVPNRERRQSLGLHYVWYVCYMYTHGSSAYVGNAHDELSPSVERTLLLPILDAKQVDLPIVTTGC